MRFLAGAGRADITPKIGTALFGYRPNHFSTSLHDRQYATACAFSDGVETVVLVTADVCEVKTSLADEIRKKAGEASGLAAERIILSATHTHSGANVAGMEGWGDIDKEYAYGIFLPGIVKAVCEAAGSLEPAVIGVGTTESLVGINRREIFRGGFVGLGQNPWGPYDPEMTVISVKSESGKGIVNLVHYGCHGTASGDNTEITRDWYGVMTDRLERESGVMTAYWQGACGDVGPRLSNGFTTGDINYAMELGGIAASDAVRAWRGIREFGKADIGVRTGTVKLPVQPLPSMEETERILAEYPEPEKLINISAMRYGHFRDVRKAIEAGEKGPGCFCFDVTVVAIGGIVFIPFPFEMFSEITLRLRKYAHYAHVLSLSNSNGTNEYLPSKGEILRGGYEVDCFRYGRVFPLTDNADDLIIEEILKMIPEKKEA